MHGIPAMLTNASPRGPGGLASAAPARPRHYEPGEFSLELAKLGINRSPKWVRNECHHGRIETNKRFSGRHLIPESELFRFAGIAEAAS